VDALPENIEHPESGGLERELRAIRERCAGHPVLDPRSADEILGYDEQGLPR
jgi:antitoxin VapB